jgi:ribonuclease HI
MASNNISKPHVTIYTDGGCEPNPGVGGWAALLLFDGARKELSGGERQTTNNQMELTAVINALDALPESHQVDLHTDSQYVKRGITEWMSKWVKNGWMTANKTPVANQELWQQLDDAVQRHTIKWHWVKGHAGHEHNERVDQLAMLEIAAITGKPVKIKLAAATAGAVQADIYIYISASYDYDGQKGGWGAVIVNGENQQELSGTQANTSENQLLLTAAARALETLSAPATIALYTDSEYIQKGMSQWIKGWIKKGWQTASGQPVKNQDLWKWLHKAAQSHTIQWLYQDKSANTYTQRAHQLASQS